MSIDRKGLDAAIIAYCKATGLNPAPSAAILEEAIKQAIEAYLLKARMS